MIKEYLIQPPGKFSFHFRELWQYRELLFFFTWRDIKVKYKQTLLGFLWAVLQPLALMLVFVLFFSNGLKISTGDIPAPLFYFSGLLLWNYFATGVSGAAESMVANANIIKKIYFPRLIIPFSSILTAAVDFFMAFLIFLVLLLWYALATEDFHCHWSRLFWALPLSLLIATGTALGLGTLLAALNVLYRDFRYVLPFLVQILFFLTPVIYTAEVFAGKPGLQYATALNPMSAVMALVRSPFVSMPLDWTLIFISFATMSLLLLTGIYVFRKMEAYFADLA